MLDTPLVSSDPNGTRMKSFWESTCGSYGGLLSGDAEPGENVRSVHFVPQTRRGVLNPRSPCAGPA